MGRWFAKLMQESHAGPRHPAAADGVVPNTDLATSPDPRDARYDAIVQKLRDREVEDRAARERRQRGYKQSLDNDAAAAANPSAPASPVRLFRFPTKVPCRATPEARALLEQLRKRFSGCTVAFPQLANGQQAVMLTGTGGTDRKQIGWVEHCVQTDPKLCNVRHQGLSVETDGGSMLVLRFCHPRTAARMCSRSVADHAAAVDFAEVRPALQVRPTDKGSSPRLVWVTRPEVEMLNAVQSREYEVFYVRFKLEVLGGIWSSLSGLLASSPASQLHRGSYYTVLREPEAASGRIHQRTLDDSGRAVDIGSNRVYDAAPATDILLLYLDGDLLADIADIYFTLQSVGDSESYFLKEELFTVVRRFWAGAQSLAWRYGDDLAAVMRMCQRALPTPYQASLLKQDWTNLRQALVDRYGDGGRKAPDLVGRDIHRRRTGPAGWPFASFPAGDINLGLRVVYRQEWRDLGVERGQVIRAVPSAPAQFDEALTPVSPGTTTRRGAAGLQRVETTIERGNRSRTLEDILGEAVRETVDAMRWPVDVDGSINTGVRALAATTGMGLESESRECSRDISTHLTEIMRRMASRSRDATAIAASVVAGEDPDSSSATTDGENASEPDEATYVYSRLQQRYEVLTRAAEVQNVLLVAEKLPTPAEIDLAWARRHGWILRKVLLDESFRDALESIPQAAGTPDPELGDRRQRLYEHLRANILHYQRAIWQHEDPQQRRMRYRKSGAKVPLDWRFELESGTALTVEELGDRLTATNVDGQFAAYSGGREADLDQVIDPAGPVGYHGNYAVYQMRSELGSEDLFSMLHFFKSPYLRPHPETGEPEVGDPAENQPRRIALDTGGMVIDVIRDVAVVPDIIDGRDAVAEPPGAANEYALVMDGEDEIPLLSASGRRDAQAAWEVLREDGARMPSLVAGSGGAAAPVREKEGELVVLTSSDGAPAHGLLAGRARDPADERLVTAGEMKLTTLVGARAAEDDQRVLLAAGDLEKAGAVLAGAITPARDQQMIIAAFAGELRLASAPLAAAAQRPERLILSRADEERTLTLRAGRAAGADLELVIATEDTGDHILDLRAGPARDPSRQRVILARGESVPGLTALSGAGALEREQPLILAPGDGARTLIAGTARAHDSDAQRVIVTAGDENPTPRLFTGSGVARVRDREAERVILARGDGERILGLLAGAGGGAARAHDREAERTILSREENEWLRPSLVAG